MSACCVGSGVRRGTQQLFHAAREGTTADNDSWVERKVRVVERFRAYGSYEEALRDWASLIGNSPRYAGVVRAGGTVEGFAQNLQRAGYATDPQYADKLTRTINQTLRIGRLVV